MSDRDQTDKKVEGSRSPRKARHKLTQPYRVKFTSTFV